MKRFIIALALACAGCSTTETVYLARDGQTVQCGPYKEELLEAGGPAIPERRLRQCVEDFQRAGYQRIAPPR